MNDADIRLRVGLHIGQLTQAVPGGIGRVTDMLCRGLPALAEVTALSSGSKASRRRLAREHPALRFCDVGFGAQALRYEIWHRLRHPVVDLPLDVVHAPSLAVPACRAPLVVSVNDLAFRRHPETGTRHGVRFHERGLAIARREASAIVTPSRFTRDELIKEGFNERSVYHVPLACTPIVPQSRDNIRRTLETLAIKEPFVLAVGTIEPRKDHATLVAAFARVRTKLPDTTLVIAGAPGWMSQPDQQDLGGPGVVVTGKISDAQLASLYTAATVVVTTSLYEGFGLSVLEALAHGRPVIASDIRAHREIAADAARFFSARDDLALAEQLHELLGDHEVRAHLGRRGRARAQTFTPQAMIRGHLDVYQAVAQR